MELHYQPIVMLDNPTVAVGYEALLRWDPPELGRVSPGDFIPIAEESGEISQVSAWVIENAVKQVAAWECRFPVSINVSPRDLEKGDFTPQLCRVCNLHNVPFSHLSLEVTEHAVADNLRYYEAVLDELHALKVALKIDDFGTGDSSLKRLLQTPWHSVKIDRLLRSEERRVGKECRSRWSPYH